MATSHVSIVIPAHNQAEITRQCIASILANTAYPYRVILVDNGSEPPLADDYADRDPVTVLRSDANQGFAAGANRGMREATGHVLLLNNDTLVPQGWLTRMVEVLESAPDIGALGPMTNCASGPQQIPELTLTDMAQINQYALARRRDFGEDIRAVARLVGFCMLIRREVVDTVGLLDERFATGNFEDDDYCVRILRAGYRLCVDGGSFVFHYGSQTFKAMGLTGDAWEALIAQNEARFSAKWALRPEDRLDSFQEALMHNREGGRRLAAGDRRGAIEAYVAGIRVEPHCARNHNDLAVALWQHGEREKAFDRVKQALQVEPENGDARANLADMAAALGREEEVNRILTRREKGAGP